MQAPSPPLSHPTRAPRRGCCTAIGVGAVQRHSTPAAAAAAAAAAANLMMLPQMKKKAGRDLFSTDGNFVQVQKPKYAAFFGWRTRESSTRPVPPECHNGVVAVVNRSSARERSFRQGPQSSLGTLYNYTCGMCFRHSLYVLGGRYY
jgi:hypothetical protein